MTVGGGSGRGPADAGVARAINWSCTAASGGGYSWDWDMPVGNARSELSPDRITQGGGVTYGAGCSGSYSVSGAGWTW